MMAFARILIRETSAVIMMIVSFCIFIGFDYSEAATSVNANLAYQHLVEQMDKYHNSFYVYYDNDSGGNHFYPSGWMGMSVLSLDLNWMQSPDIGNSCIKVTFSPKSSSDWAGIYWQEPHGNWGTIPNAGYDLTGAQRLVFKAKGQIGGERVEFMAGGIGWSPYQTTYQDSFIYKGDFTLTNSWEEYAIPLIGKNLNHVIGGFGFAVDYTKNNNGVIFYLDNIRYEQSRSDELRFIESYVTMPSDHPTLFVKNACSVYDNALALISFLTRSTEDDLRRAKILADSFVYAQNHDRQFSDGRLRNAYSSGDLKNHSDGKARLPGWWSGAWKEDSMLLSTNTGNMAWIMIALLTYYQKFGGAVYLDSAKKIGEWIETNARDERSTGGYTGGHEKYGMERVLWKGTEHNINLFNAFSKLYEIEKDEKWKIRADHALKFVSSMWNDPAKHFWTGTITDGSTVFWKEIPAAIHARSVMAMGEFSSAMDDVKGKFVTESDGIKGFDSNMDRDGICLSTTAQMAVGYQTISQNSDADIFIGQLRNTQVSSINGNGKGIIAASHDGMTAGFGDFLYRRLHIGATAWFIFAETKYNPYGTPSPVSPNVSKAIIVAGGGPYPENDIWQPTLMNADYAHIVLNLQGYTANTIYYLSAGYPEQSNKSGVIVDGDATIVNFEYAITEWAKDAENLLIYMVDHGKDREFLLKKDHFVGEITLTADNLKEWLKTAHERIPGQVIVIYDACQSGSFIPILALDQDELNQGKKRAVMTSNSDGLEAKTVMSVNGTLSFSFIFWGRIFLGSGPYDAFVNATDLFGFAYSKQTPLFDADGNGIVEDRDNNIAHTITFGKRQIKGCDTPKIGEISPCQTIVNNCTNARIYAKNITDADGIEKVWAVITPPNFHSDNPETPVTDLPSIELLDSDNNGTYEAVYNNFAQQGVYHILIYAKDKCPFAPVIVQKNTTITKIDSADLPDLADIILILNVLAGCEVCPLPVMNDDNKLDMKDVIMVLQKIACLRD